MKNKNRNRNRNRLWTLAVGTTLWYSSLQANVFETVEPEQVPSGITYNVTQPTVESASLFTGKKVGIIASHGVEESEIQFPYIYLTERGADVEFITPDWASDGIVASQFLKPTLFVKSSQTFTTAQKVNYDLLVLTGGAWNAQVVRSDKTALDFIASYYKSGKPLAAICAGSSVLINAGIAKGQRLTGSSVIATDLINAGAFYVDKEVVYGDHLVTSRSPNDLRAFTTGLKTLLLKY